MNKIDPAMATMLGRRGFGPGGTGAPPSPPKPVPRALRDGEVDLGRASNGDIVGLHLGKLIEGRLLIQGNSGAGKSMLLRRLFEQAFGLVQQLLIDPDGEFSTLAEKFDVVIFSAADALRVGGRAMALHLRQHRYSAVLDLSDATSEQRLEIVAELTSGLIDAPPEHWHPLLVLVDEAQTMAPHKRAIAGLADVMSRGRKRGIAGVIATQRLAETSKAVVSKATNIIVGRTIFDLDLERAGALLGFTAGRSRALSSLADGEFVCLGPALAGPTRLRFKAGAVQSRHKGDAPKVDAPPRMTAAAAFSLLQALPAVVAAMPQAGGHAPGRGRRGRDWSAAEDEIIRAGYAVGAPLVQIGGQLAAIGLSASTSNISMRAHALGLVSAKAAVAWSDR
jgi:DNA helicase HerA-like ATPase